MEIYSNIPLSAELCDSSYTVRTFAGIVHVYNVENIAKGEMCTYVKLRDKVYKFKECIDVLISVHEENNVIKIIPIEKSLIKLDEVSIYIDDSMLSSLRNMCKMICSEVAKRVHGVR